MLQATSFDKLCNPVSQADTNIFTSNSLHHKTLPFRHVSLFHTCNWLLLPSFSEYRNAFLFASIASPTLEKLTPHYHWCSSQHPNPHWRRRHSDLGRAYYQSSFRIFFYLKITRNVHWLKFTKSGKRDSREAMWRKSTGQRIKSSREWVTTS